MHTINYAIKNIGHHARLKENEHLFRYRAKLERNFFRCVHACAHLRTLMTRKSSGIPNAMLRSHLKVIPLKLFYYQTCFETW